MNVPACFVFRPGNKLVATVQRYPVKNGPELLALYRGLHTRNVRVPALGAQAVLFDIVARPRNYQEVILFSGAGYVLATRTPLIIRAGPPLAPETELLTLLRGVRSRLDAGG